jgi:signal transduction histidine kinase
MCEKILNIDLEEFGSNEYPTLVIRDLKQSVEHANRTYVKETIIQFYAGAPLLSPSGAIVGSLCILDDTPRPDGLSKEHRHSLRDIAQSVMDYLHTYTIKDQFWRGERFTRGLISFSEGAENSRPFKNASEAESDSPRRDHGTAPDALASPFDERSDPMDRQALVASSATTTLRSPTRQHRSVKKLQETIVPLDARSMFSRAANVMMASTDLDGVVILDASIAANRRRRRSHSQEGHSTATGTETEDAWESNHTATSSSEGSSSNRAEDTDGSSSKYAQVLGSATKGANPGKPTFGSLAESDLSRMLHNYPHGKIITFGVDGLALSSTDESSTSNGTSKSSSKGSSKRKDAGSRVGKNSRALRAMLTGARSVAFIPFWDYERSRWYAGCLCWSNVPHRLLSASVDLPYFKIFSHSVMRELSRLDALASNQSKTTFVASISHELRSPLHGILGTLEFIKDTPLDSFQTSMLNSLNACGNTLLDTINHVMDYAEIGEPTKNISSRRLKSTHTVRLSSKPLKSRRSRAGAFDLSIATEEVVEAVFSGSTYIPVTRSMMDAPSSPSGSDAEQAVNRKICYVALDIAQEDDWSYCFPVGSWRRIVMNIFGNAIKYTHSGHIHVTLRAIDWSKATGTPTTVILTVVDSGIGMSSKFLADKAFQPFSQEDSVRISDTA